MNTPEASQFVSDQVRPLAELARDFIIRATPALQQWVAVEPLLVDDEEIIEDNRIAEGVPPVTCGQVRSFMSIIAGLNFAESANAISIPCVREPLKLD